MHKSAALIYTMLLYESLHPTTCWALRWWTASWGTGWVCS